MTGTSAMRESMIASESSYSRMFFSFIRDKPELFFNPLTINVPHHIEASQLISNANQLTGFYMMENSGP